MYPCPSLLLTAFPLSLFCVSHDLAYAFGADRCCGISPCPLTRKWVLYCLFTHSHHQCFCPSITQAHQEHRKPHYSHPLWSQGHQSLQDWTSATESKDEHFQKVFSSLLTTIVEPRYGFRHQRASNTTPVNAQSSFFLVCGGCLLGQFTRERGPVLTWFDEGKAWSEAV